MDTVTFSMPPLPVFIKGAESVFLEGKKHFRRTFSVFDLLYVKRGCLYMTENGREFAVGSGHYLLLIPGREHYGHRPCEERTELVWLHYFAARLCGRFRLRCQPADSDRKGGDIHRADPIPALHTSIWRSQAARAGGTAAKSNRGTKHSAGYRSAAPAAAVVH